MKKSIVVGLIISGVTLLAAMATAGAAESPSPEPSNSVVTANDPNGDIWEPTRNAQAG